MQLSKKIFLLINILGGLAVLGSYAWGFLTHQDARGVLWGGVPPSIRPFYSIGMLLAAIGYFAFTGFILFVLNPVNVEIFNRFSFEIFNFLFIAILLPSAGWMPLTFLAIQHSSSFLSWLVRFVLIIVGLASIFVLLALLSLKPSQPAWSYRLAVLGSIFFCIQTALLDAVIWGTYFHPG